MREIKFRAWDKENKRYIYIADESNDTAIWFDENGWYLVSTFTGSPVEIFNHSNGVLEMSTGLYDKNGKEVYEGDILDFDASEWGEPNFVSVVTWDEIDGCWDWGGGNVSDLKEWRAVVGNIHENPELLEQK